MEGQDKQQQSPGGNVGGGGYEAAAPMDTRPSDVEVFLDMLPTLVGSYAAHNNDPKTVSDLAINLARQTTGGLVQLGVCRATAWCTDNRPLALGLPQATERAMPPVNGGNRLSGLAAHYPTTQTQNVRGL